MKKYFLLIFTIIFWTGAFFVFKLLLAEFKKPVPQEKKPTQVVKKLEKPKPAPQVEIPKITIPYNKYDFTYTYKILTQGKIQNLIFKMYIPRNDSLKQNVQITAISQKPDKFYKTNNGSIAEYIFQNVQDKQITISYKGTIKTRTFDMKSAKKLNQNIMPEADITPYLRPEKYIESNDPLIIQAANTINAPTVEETVAKIYKFVQDNLKYQIVPNIGAKAALQRRIGKCSEYSALMVALCRAKKIPARIVTGNILINGDTNHAWVEVYYDKYGWVTYDPTALGVDIYQRNPDGSNVFLGTKVSADEAQADYIILSRNEIEHMQIQYDYLSGQNPKAKVLRYFSFN